MEQFFGEVRLPKTIGIRNMRLGILQRFLQFAVVLGFVVRIVLDQSWYLRQVPASSMISVWMKGGGDAMDDLTVPHCNAFPSYEYYWSATFAYLPNRCKKMESLEIYAKDSDTVFVHTLVQDTKKWTASGSTCNVTADSTYKDNCEKQGGAFTPSTGDSDSCECKVYDEYFAQNPEKMKLYFLHGYEVEIDTTGSAVQRASTTSDDITISRTGQADHHSTGGIRTKLVSQKTGNECSFGGRSEWFPEQSRGGIGGTIEELLTCAGLSLDEKSDLLRSNDIDESGAPHIRIGGARIRLDLHYENSASHQNDFDDVLCSVTVSAFPAWSSSVGITHSDMPIPTSDHTTTLSRYGYGVMVGFTVTGTMLFTDVITLYDDLLKMLVTMLFVNFFIQAVVYRGIGFESQLYHAAAHENLDPQKELLGIVCRRACYMQSFHTLTRKRKGELNRQSYRDVFSSIFKDPVENGQMTERDLARFAMHLELELFKSNGQSRDYISSADWTSHCSSREPTKCDLLGEMFNSDRQVPWGERLFGSLGMKRSPAFKKEPPKLKDAVAFYDDTDLKLHNLTERVELLAANVEADPEFEPPSREVPVADLPTKMVTLAEDQVTVRTGLPEDYEKLLEMQRTSLERVENRMETWKMSFEVQAYRKIDALEAQVLNLQQQLKKAKE